MTMLDLSVVIVSFNTGPMTLACLGSLFEWTRGVEFEVFVVDNGSRDGSPQMIRHAFPQVILIEQQSNVGFARACNAALVRARGRYIMLLNSDTLLIEDALTALVHALDAHPQVGAVGPRMIYADGQTQSYSATRAKTLWRTLAQYCIPRRGTGTLHLGPRLNSKPSATSPVLYETESISGAAMMIRREILHTVGLLDERFFLYCEDADWVERIRHAGYVIACAPDVRLIHHHGASSRQDEIRREVEAVRSNIRYFAKHSGKGSVVFFRVAVAAIMCLRMVTLDLFRALTGTNPTRLRRDWEVFRQALTFGPNAPEARDRHSQSCESS
ncbi:MAG TPA: glycosyltransferase family 2 protein [Blastocatellia bacterium]|nr:glycosyltransferase family 2 protein [Blastocatellia bacterium]